MGNVKISFIGLDQDIYGNVIYDWSGRKPTKIEIEDGVEFDIIDVRTNRNRYICTVTLDEENLSKLKRQNPELYEKIKTTVKELFFYAVMKSVIDYMRDAYSRGETKLLKLLGSGEFESLVEYVDRTVDKYWKYMTENYFKHKYTDDNLVDIMTDMKVLEVSFPVEID
jgi:hypothetical protein